MRTAATSRAGTRSARWAALPIVALLTMVGAEGTAVGQATPTCHGVPATLVGTPRSDILTGTTGRDVIVGLGGSDSIYGRDGADRICGGDGRDFVFGDQGPDVVRGGAGDDWIGDALGANRVFGGDGDDRLQSGGGDERLDGGEGRDVADYSTLIEVDGESTHCHDVVVDLAAGRGRGDGFGLDQLVALEGAYTGGGDDVLLGDGGSNTFYVGGILCGRVRSDDRVEGHGGRDTITFASALVEFGSADGRVLADLRTGEAFSRGNGGAHHLGFTSIENLDGTGDFRDTLIGNSAANVFNAGWAGQRYGRGSVVHGGRGADWAYGTSGSDELRGGAGPDVLRGHGGADLLWGNKGPDLLDGGRGANENHGGGGVDECHRPRTGLLASGCEGP